MGEAPYHFVFCRNLLIYFDPDTQRRAVQTLRRLAAPDGMIFVGPAEASLLTREGLASAGVPLAFAFHPGSDRLPAAAGAAPCAPVPHAPPRMLEPTPKPHTPAAPRGPARTAVRATARTGLASLPHPAPASPSAAADGADLAAIAAQADRGDLAVATAACLEFVAQHGSSANGWCLLGVLHDAAGRTADAHAAYRKAVYLDPGHEEALYHLAALLDSEGDAAGAHRLRERAQRHARLSHD